jgi:hypothetical protein
MGYDLQWVNDRRARGYRRYNLGGMQVLRDILRAAGALDARSTPRPSPSGRATRAVLAFRSVRPGRVPLLKLVTNDGWVVTPAECRLLARALEERGARAIARLARAGRLEDPEYWSRDILAFARYCRGAAAAGGFRVW